MFNNNSVKKITDREIAVYNREKIAEQDLQLAERRRKIQENVDKHRKDAGYEIAKIESEVAEAKAKRDALKAEIANTEALVKQEATCLKAQMDTLKAEVEFLRAALKTFADKPTHITVKESK